MWLSGQGYIEENRGVDTSVNVTLDPRKVSEIFPVIKYLLMHNNFGKHIYILIKLISLSKDISKISSPFQNIRAYIK